LIGADKNHAAGHGRGADRIPDPKTVRRSKIRDPADAVLFGGGAGVECMQLAVATAR